MSNKGVRKPKEFAKLIESLVNKNDKNRDVAPFETFASLMAFAAVIGAKFCPDDFYCDYKPYADPIKTITFHEKNGIINLLAIYKKNELNILANKNDEKEKSSIFEGYAYAGLKKIKSIVEKPGFPLDNLINFIQASIESDNKNLGGREIDLSSLISD